MTMAEAVKEVETLLAQTASEIRVAPVRIMKALNDRLLALSAEGPIGEAWGTLTAISAGTDTYTISAEYQNVETVQRQSDGMLLNKRTPEWIRRQRIGPAAATPSGPPTDFATIEAISGTDPIASTKLDVWPKPTANDTLKALTQATPFPLGETSTDAIPLGFTLCVALTRFAAADLAGDAAPSLWLKVAERALEAEKERVYDQRSQSDITLNEA